MTAILCFPGCASSEVGGGKWMFINWRGFQVFRHILRPPLLSGSRSFEKASAVLIQTEPRVVSPCMQMTVSLSAKEWHPFLAGLQKQWREPSDRKATSELPTVNRAPKTIDLAHVMSGHLKAIASSQDRKAFEEVFRHFAPRVKAYLSKAGGDAGAAEELMQETMAAVWRKAAQFDPAKASASTWIFTIARNLKIDAYRRERRPELDPDDPALVPEEEPPADSAFEARQTAEAIHDVLATLSQAEQEVLKLAFFEDKSQSAIASQLGIPLGTVKSRMRLSFGKLRTAMSEMLGDCK